MKTIHLRTLRERRHLTQEQLETLSGVAQNTISKLERNPLARPGFAVVAAIAKALRVDPYGLRFGPDPTRNRVPPGRAASSKVRVSA